MFKNKALLPIFVVVFVDLLGFSIILPLMPFYAQDYGASPALIGLFVASYSIFQFISSPILGAMSDKYGRRPLLIYSQIGSMIGFILLGIGGSMIVLFISRIIDGISGGNLTIAQAYIADVTEPHERASSLALIGIAFGLGFMMGPFIGGELSTLFGRSAPAYCAAAMALASTLLTFFYLKEPPHRPQEHAKSGLGYYLRSLEYFKEITLRELLLIFFFFSFPFTLYVSMFSLYAHIELNFNEAEVGRFLAYVGFLGIIWQGGVIRVLVKKVSELSLLRTGLAAMMIGLLLIVFAQNWLQLGLVALVFSFGTSITRPILSSLLTKAAPPERKGGVLGVASSIESFTRIIAPIIGGQIIGSLHPNYIGYVGCALAAVGVFLAMKVRMGQDADSTNATA
jgi:MFS family permease